MRLLQDPRDSFPIGVDFNLGTMTECVLKLHDIVVTDTALSSSDHKDSHFVINHDVFIFLSKQLHNVSTRSPVVI